MWYTVAITFIITFAVCEYYNRRIIAAIEKRPMIRRKPNGRSPSHPSHS